MDRRNHEMLLVLQSQCGDREALEELLRGIKSPILSYISHLTNSDEAEDVLQDVMFQICRHIKGLRDPELFRAWVYRIATRTAFAFIKRRRLWQNYHDKEIEVENLPAFSEPYSGIVADEVLRAIGTISPKSKAVLLLHYLEDLTIQEIAANLELSAGTVKSRLAYGLSSLRAIVVKKG